MAKQARSIAFTLLATAILAPLAWGQAQTTGRLEGVVVDAEGVPAAGARVTLVSPALQGERVLATNERGEFLAALLPAGPYAVSIVAPGKRTVQVSLRISVGRTEPLEVVLQPGSDAMETITVYASASPLETTAIGTTFDFPEDVEALPIPDRRIERVVALAPNVSNIPTRNQDYLSIAGANPRESAWLLDGAELTDNLAFLVPTMYIDDAVQAVEVQTAGVSARYGRFQGGLVNAITKTGGNEYSGTVRAEFTKESWNGTTPLDEEQSDDLGEVYQATFGGYVQKDRLWFFLGGRTIPTVTTSSTARDTQEPVDTNRSEERLQFKLRGAVRPEHIIEANYLEYELDIDGSSPSDFCCIPGDALAANGRGRFPRDIVTLSYQGILGPRTFVEFLASTKNVASARGGDPAGGSPIVDIRAPSSDGYVGYHNNVLDPRDSISRDTDTAGVNLTRVLPTKARGSHTLEAGVQYVTSMSAGSGRFSVNNFAFGHQGGSTPFTTVDPLTGELTFNVNSALAGGNQVNVRFEDVPFTGEQVVDNWALYVHDTWSLGKWRADLGLRWEQYDAEGPFGSLDVKADDVAPRAALTYNITPSWQLQASAGKYVGRLDDALLSYETGIGSAPQVRSVYIGPAGTGLSYDEVEALLFNDAYWSPRSASDPRTPTAQISDDVDLSYSVDYNLSVKWGLPRSSGWAEASLIYRDYQDLWDGRVGDEGSVFVPVPRSTTELEFDRIVWDNAPGAERTYRAVVLAADYRPGPRWNVGGNWTFAELEGNVDSFGLTTGSFGTWLGAYERSRPEDAAVPDGKLLDDIRQRVNAWASYHFDFGRRGALVLGSLGRYRSGAVWSRVANVATSPDPQGMYVRRPASYPHFFDGRGNNRFDDVWSLDLSARYQIQLYRQLDVWVKLTAANVLDNDTLVRFNTAGSPALGMVDCDGCYFDEAHNLTWRPSSSFGQGLTPEDYQVPRSYLFTLGLAF